ncbi:hypothetical protein ACH50O_20490 [Methylomonas sp. 2BW1-5-20]|uniref:hypothetical protein n=1 Tax=Methylomonas sp. 2BW1-5-20 TaxID=3376686 RepID=UPI0040503CBE
MEFLLLPIFIFFLYAVFSFVKNPHLAVIIILLVSVINTWFIEPPSAMLGIHVYLYDLVFVPLFLSALFRIIFLGEWRFISILWALYGLIIFYGLFAGLKIYGTYAGVDFRNFFCYWVGTLYFMSFAYSKEMLDRFYRHWVLICSLLLLIVYFRFVADFLHLPISATWKAADSTGVRFRVTDSGQAYLLSAVVIMFFLRFVIPTIEPPSRVLTVAFLLAVIVLQHRSVWGATILAIATMFLLPGIKMHKIIGKLAALGVIGMILMIPLVFYGYADSFIDSITGSAERATNLGAGTFGSRVQYWERIIIYWNKLAFWEQFLGEPFGSGYAGNVTAPHNMFFHSLLRAGAFGTFIYLLFYSILLVKLFLYILMNKNDRLYPSQFFMLIVAQIAFYIPYSPQPQHGILLGIAASLVIRGIAEGGGNKERNAKYFLNATSNKRHDAKSA